MDGEKKRQARIWTVFDRFTGDKVILMVALLLMLISIISVFSSTPLLVDSGRGIDRMSIMMRQLKAVGAGVAVILAFYFLGSSKLYRNIAVLCLVFSLSSLLILVANLNLGPVKAGVINGARRIILLGSGGTQIHVYEFVKVGMVIYLAWALDTYREQKFRWTAGIARRHPKLAWINSPLGQKAVYIYLPIGAATFMVMMGSNSSALFLALIMVLMILVGGIDFKDVLVMMLVFLVGGLCVLGAYKAGWIEGRVGTAISRITNNDEDTMQILLNSPPGSQDYNEARDALKQPVGALLAIKEGGLLGKGIGGSDQRYAVPVIFGDYMFSFIIEETGLLGAIFLILLYFSLLARGTMIAGDCDEYFDKILVVGLIILVTGQAFMHMAVNVHLPLVPQTGQTLPLVSHGTTSFLVFSAVFGILLSISRRNHAKMAKREAEVTPIIEHHEDPVRSGIDDLDALESLND